ncbi:MAG: DUF2852 domain-containing protein [Alphaproteobacteria bacterium]|nr:DUF2852 domain-containing protein [Alphaproteobacteria bacterium]
MGIAAKLDEIGKPAWITLMVLGFVFWWPFGLAMLAFLIGSGRMGCWRNRERWQREFKDRVDDVTRRWGSETLKRLEEEQKEFREFLERLRHAKDKAEFDQFMADRRRRDNGPAPQPQAS